MLNSVRDPLNSVPPMNDSIGLPEILEVVELQSAAWAFMMTVWDLPSVASVAGHERRFVLR